MMRKSKDFLTMSIVISALVLSLAACGSSQNSGGSGNSGNASPAENTTEAENTEATEETEAAPAETETAGTTEEVAEPETEAVPETAEVEGTVFENGGYKLTIPNEYVEELVVETPQDDENGILFSVSEKASIEADRALGYEFDGSGWLFSILCVDEERAHQMMCYDMTGAYFFAEDTSGKYFVVGHPTDVRYSRETPEQMQADQDRWVELVQWGGTAGDTFIKENAGLTPFTWGGTEIEAHLAKIMYEEDVNYTISTLEFGPLEPGDVDPKPYFDKLTTGAMYEYEFNEEAPDGEYAVLAFPDEDLRFDFFFQEGKENYIRMVWGEDEFEQLFKVTFADGTTKASAVMNEWYQEIAAGR